MASYQKFIFSTKPAPDFLSELRVACEKFCQKSKHSGSLMADAKNLRIEFGREEYYFYFSLIDADWVIAESREIALNHPQSPESSVVRDCTYRVEFSGEDDLHMDYFNDFLDLLDTVRQIEGVAIYDYQNSQYFIGVDI